MTAQIIVGIAIYIVVALGSIGGLAWMAYKAPKPDNDSRTVDELSLARQRRSA